MGKDSAPTSGADEPNFEFSGEALTRAIAETSLDATLIMDHQGRIREFNRAAESMFGRKRVDVLGRLVGDVIVPLSMREAHANGLKRFLESREPKILGQRLRLSALRFDGTEFPVELTVTQIRSDEPPVFAGSIRDITPEIEHERELNKARLLAEDALAALEQERGLLAQRVEERTADVTAANVELARASRLKDEFLATMSHELRTPLNTVLGMSEALVEGVYGSISPDQHSSLSLIHESGDHLLSLINDILDLSKVEAGQLKLDLAPCSIADLCESSVRLVRPAIGKKRLQFKLEDQSSQRSVVVDYRRLQQALVSLLSNAIKFTPEGGEFGLSVFQTGDGEDKFLSLQVWDKGIGIPEAEIENLFVPFQQLDGGLARQHSGTGLGLVIAKRMVELHGGTLHLDSVEGEGTRVTITLPLVPASTASLQLSQGE